MQQPVVNLPWLNALQQSLAPWPQAWPTVVLVALVAVAWLANLVTKKILLRGLRHVIERVSGPGHDSRLPMRAVARLANVVPSVVIAAGLALVPRLPAELVVVLKGACHVWTVATIALAAAHAFDAFNAFYERRPDARNKPIKGYLQVAKLVVFALAGLSIVATLAGVKLLHVLTGLGAATAVLMLIFQDTILSLVASVQISGDGRVRIGDWIEMPSQNADGDVIDIALHTVTVQNFDKTITTIPTKKLVTESFKNWRGMQESGGRRIKRAILLDQHSVRFLDDALRPRIYQFALLEDYLASKREELGSWNAQLAQVHPEPVNARRLTNLGTFRAYVERYLRSHPGIHQEMTVIVRQMAPTAEGLPLEIWCFTNTTVWARYEAIQADIFDHLLATLSEFDLRVFQQASDSMLRSRAPRPNAGTALPVVATGSGTAQG
jgi:miniconductance mechanosensitive channel